MPSSAYNIPDNGVLHTTGDQARYINKVGERCRTIDCHSSLRQADAAVHHIHFGGSCHAVAYLFLLGIPAERECVEHDMGHGTAGNCFAGVCADDNKPDTQPEVRIVDSVACGHPVVLDSCLLIPCREHVSSGGHILLHSSYTLLLPHIYKCGA